MYKSESFGRIFWVDDNNDFKSCPLCVDGTGDFTCEDYEVSQKWLIGYLSLFFKILPIQIILIKI